MVRAGSSTWKELKASVFIWVQDSEHGLVLAGWSGVDIVLAQKDKLENCLYTFFKQFNMLWKKSSIKTWYTTENRIFKLTISSFINC